MSEESVLTRAGEIYTPFSAQETRRLQEFVQDVEELVGSAFFQAQQQQTLTISGSTSGPLTTTLSYSGEESVRAITGLFRQLYNHNEPTSYSQILKLLSRHAHDHASELGDRAVAELKRLREWEKEALAPQIALKCEHVRRDGSTEEEELTPVVLIDLFLHGKYLHKGNEKSDKLAAWPLAHLAQHIFFGTVITLSRVWWVGHNVARAALSLPTVHPN